MVEAHLVLPYDAGFSESLSVSVPTNTKAGGCSQAKQPRGLSPALELHETLMYMNNIVILANGNSM
jgi:hypothetical protein